MIKQFERKNEFQPSMVFDAVEAKENNLIGKKLLENRQFNRMTIDEVCMKLSMHGIHIQKSAYNKWELGTTVPNGYQLLAYCAAFGIDDAASFFGGKSVLNDEGRKKVAAYRDDLIASGRYMQPPPSIIKYIEMPISCLAASAGTGSFLDEGAFEMIRIPEKKVPAGADFGIRVSGDSMEPVFSSGQIAWVKECETLNPGEVGIFVLDGEGYIKEYSEQEPENIDNYTDSLGVAHAQPVLVSYNPKYSPIVVSNERSLRIIGKVLN